MQLDTEVLQKDFCLQPIHIFFEDNESFRQLKNKMTIQKNDRHCIIPSQGVKQRRSTIIFGHVAWLPLLQANSLAVNYSF